MTKSKITYWISTGLLALFILPGIFYINSEMAIEGTRHLGLPEWFRLEATIASFVAGIVLIVPVCGTGLFGRLWSRFKEWAYVGMGITYVSAFIAHMTVDGVIPMSFFPLVTFALLTISYTTYHNLNSPRV